VKILGIDTASSACTVALFDSGTILSGNNNRAYRHTEIILPQIHALLAEAGYRLSDLDALAFGRGPGGFTGLRIGAGVVQGLALGTGLPIIGVSSLMAMAWHTQQPKVAVSLDARMQEVYVGYYQRNTLGMQAVGEEQLLKPDSISVEPGWFLAGNGWELTGMASTDYDGNIVPHAQAVVELAANMPEDNWVGAEEVLPVYLRGAV
jgi:tRNA threonylcarbamoyladenosine biosynthesis protein TsaB